jgi:hypothetical protein
MTSPDYLGQAMALAVVKNGTAGYEDSGAGFDRASPWGVRSSGDRSGREVELPVAPPPGGGLTSAIGTSGYNGGLLRHGGTQTIVDTPLPTIVASQRQALLVVDDLVPDPALIFFDGFETGDVSAWSAAVE